MRRLFTDKNIQHGSIKSPKGHPRKITGHVVMRYPSPSSHCLTLRFAGYRPTQVLQQSVSIQQQRQRHNSFQSILTRRILYDWRHVISSTTFRQKNYILFFNDNRPESKQPPKPTPLNASLRLDRRNAELERKQERDAPFAPLVPIRRDVEEIKVKLRLVQPRSKKATA